MAVKKGIPQPADFNRRAEKLEQKQQLTDAKISRVEREFTREGIAARFRRKVHESFTSSIVTLLLLVAGFSVVAVLLDVFMPQGKWWNVIRFLAAAPIAYGVFGVVYMVSVVYTIGAKHKNSDYLPVRERISHRTRWQIAIPVMAVLFVAAAGDVLSGGWAYTCFAGWLMAGYGFVTMFLRKTLKERALEEKGLVDVRDMVSDWQTKLYMEEYEAAKEEAKSQKAAKKDEKKAPRGLLGKSQKKTTAEKLKLEK